VAGGVWIHMLSSIPYLSSPTSGSPLGVALHAAPHAGHARALTRGAQAPPISHHWPVKWWYGGAETDSPTHLICTAFRRFGNCEHDHLDPDYFHCVVSCRFRDHGHDCLTSRDFCYVVIAHGELHHMTVPPGAQNRTSQRPARIMGHHVSAVLCHRFEIPTYKTQKGCTGKDAGPTHGFVASPGVGQGVTVGTLKTGYPRVQAPSIDERQDGHTCPRVPWLSSLDTGQLQSCHVPHVSSSRHQAPRQLWDRHVPYGPSFDLLAQDSSKATTCPLGSSSLLLA
jgi:hypothetical protein